MSWLLYNVKGMLKYASVGFLGLGVHLTMLYIGVTYFNLFYLLSAMIASGCAMVFNYFLGQRIGVVKSYKDADRCSCE